MACALVRIEKSYQGETWENTYGVIVSSSKVTVDTSPQYTSEVDSQLGFSIGANYSDAGTNPTSAGYQAASFVTALIAFERLVHSNGVVVTKMTVTDGQFGTQAFRSVQLGYQCLTQIDHLAPGSICLLVRRMPATISVKPGRLYYRLALSESWVTPAGSKLIGLDSPAGQSASLTTKVNQSGLSNYYHSQTEGGTFVCLAIPRYEPFTGGDGKKHYNMVDAVAVEKLDNVDAVSRQVKRGRRRPVNP